MSETQPENVTAAETSSTEVSGGRQVIAGMVGNMMEWYDFAVYGYFAVHIGQQFFPSESQVASIIAAFGVFAAGFLMRPVGSVIFGHMGDKGGRKKALVISVISMALPTFLLGLLPTYEQVGLLAPILLVLLRMVQGASVGGEYTGSVTYLIEAAPDKQRGLAGSWSSAGSWLGFLVGSAVATALTHALPAEELSSWGWRIPFLAGALIGAFALIMRAGLPESASFEKMQEAGTVADNPMKHAVEHHRWEIVRVVLYLWGSAMPMYLVFTYLPTFMETYEHIPSGGALAINTMALVLVFCLVPLIGILSDKVGRKKLAVLALVLLVTTTYPLFMFMDQATNPTFEGLHPILVAQLVLGIYIALQQGVNPSFLAEQFPMPHSRSTAFGMSFNVAYAIFGGTAPLLAALFISWTGDHRAAAIYMSVACLVSLVVLFFMRDHTGKKLN